MRPKVAGVGGEGTIIEVGGDVFVIGRDESCDLTVADDRVSSRHAQIELRADGKAELRDLASSTGTFVNGERINKPVVLTDNDQICAGGTVLAVLAAEEETFPSISRRTRDRRKRKARRGSTAAPGRRSSSRFKAARANDESS